MLPDAECVKLVAEIFESLDIGDFVIKVWLSVEFTFSVLIFFKYSFLILNYEITGIWVRGQKD